MKLYTKRGDDGHTELFGGTRVPKNDPRVQAYGEVDETNAAIGLAIALSDEAEINAILRQIQSDLFVLGGELATPSAEKALVRVGESDITRLEQCIDLASDQVAPLRQFILPGGGTAAAALHVARGVCRRAERSITSLSAVETVAAETIIYMNRLSDLLFALARLANHRAAVADVPWISGKT